MSGVSFRGWSPVGFSSAQWNNPLGLLYFKNCVFVAETGAHLIRKIDLATKIVSVVAGSRRGHKDGAVERAQFCFPVGICKDNDGSILVSDYENGVIRNLSADGNVSSIGKKGALASPHGIAVTKDGDILVCEYGRGRISRLNRKGDITQFFSSSENGIFGSCPCGLTLDEAQNCYFADFGTSKLTKLCPEGKIQYFDTPILKKPMGISLDAYGNALIADYGSNLVHYIAPPQYSMKSYLTEVSPHRHYDVVGTFKEPKAALMVGTHLFVSDSGHNKVLLFEDSMIPSQTFSLFRQFLQEHNLNLPHELVILIFEFYGSVWHIPTAKVNKKPTSDLIIQV